MLTFNQRWQDRDKERREKRHKPKTKTKELRPRRSDGEMGGKEKQKRVSRIQSLYDDEEFPVTQLEAQEQKAQEQEAPTVLIMTFNKIEYAKPGEFMQYQRRSSGVPPDYLGCLSIDYQDYQPTSSIYGDSDSYMSVDSEKYRGGESFDDHTRLGENAYSLLLPPPTQDPYYSNYPYSHSIELCVAEEDGSIVDIFDGCSEKGEGFIVDIFDILNTDSLEQAEQPVAAMGLGHDDSDGSNGVCVGDLGVDFLQGTKDDAAKELRKTMGDD
ncbi:Protein of unknown function [Pyronema omphalodes CBS 100304]|uniref:Uncharacterized protein n=1 Tax=Pyronema omphalodes (strain CBS 100304) TaxID=1076935 RepID=U4LIC4_PYROM|nr:Protein of unknown function [Pyronema omphalodes CBS 100304]